ncbi:hypothetical protein [Streptomyces sp. NRRL S-350]|uniref:hypothetical protein n=1 Tax=Streptomyces sp. NRRL S-350 TaxID=1463902 RepID=UPI0004BFE8C5|nr:hypothetical protein [Streptomyces sp. NRRL S-350]
MTTNHTGTGDQPRIRITLAFFKDFPTVAGLLRETGARRVGSREFVLEEPMALPQVAALIELQQHSRRQDSNPVTVTIEPKPSEHRFYEQQDELDAWWGTVDAPNWR